ncbi:MAG TPA: hypothetical protein VGF27_19515, partial [Pseudoduganella sp.]
YVSGIEDYDELRRALVKAVEAAVTGRQDIQQALDTAVATWNKKLAATHATTTRAAPRTALSSALPAAATAAQAASPAGPAPSPSAPAPVESPQPPDASVAMRPQAGASRAAFRIAHTSALPAAPTAALAPSPAAAPTAPTTPPAAPALAESPQPPDALAAGRPQAGATRIPHVDGRSSARAPASSTLNTRARETLAEAR